FTVELDYPADLMVLHPSGTGLPRKRGEPLLFENGHLLARIVAHTDDPVPRDVPLMAQVDTGAGELTICAGSGLPLAGNHTQGLESVRGIGASETLPPYRFLAMTRRIPLSSVSLGGADVDVRIPARWLEYDRIGSTQCGEGPGGYRALLGHEYLASHRVIFDYANNRWALLPSKRPERRINAHQLLLDEEIAAHGEDPVHGLDRAELLVGVGRDRDAVDALLAWQPIGDPDPERNAEGTVLLARLLRHLGRHTEAWEVLGGMSPGDLVDQGQIVGTVNGLAIDGRTEEARQLAEEASEQREDGGWARVALADLDLREGKLDDARDHLLEAARLEGYPDAHLLRRARVALAAGDRVGSMALVRRLLQLYPGDGPYLWFYAMLVQTPQDAERFAVDLEAAMARLHPFSRPLDFLVAAHHVLGDDDEVQRLLSEGTAAHCDPLPDGPDDDNCRAWYFALAGSKPDEALTRIERALAETGERADYLDTKAMVHLSRGEWDDAVTAAQAAARLSPDDVYMLWQAERITQLARAAATPDRRDP
ncbi:MAG: hypothetical protein KC621_34525, partial [Myxococcales bacterium]|nr:hypothetical protein [Myxococcales bacterium]